MLACVESRTRAYASLPALQPSDRAALPSLEAAQHPPAMKRKSDAPVMMPSKTYTAAFTGSMATAMGSTSRTAASTSAQGHRGAQR